MLPVRLRTSRLILRRWEDGDIEPFAALNADPEVMQFFPHSLSREQTVSMVERIEAQFDAAGFSLWALELEATGDFIGFVGLSRPSFAAPFTPCVEVGWRLAKEYWGQGYAPEAAREVLRDGFERLGLPEILSFTAAVNEKSIRVMEKVRMTRDPADDFLHPMVEDGHPLQQHVLYRLLRDNWQTLTEPAQSANELSMPR